MIPRGDWHIIDQHRMEIDVTDPSKTEDVEYDRGDHEPVVTPQTQDLGVLGWFLEW